MEEPGALGLSKHANTGWGHEYSLTLDHTMLLEDCAGNVRLHRLSVLDTTKLQPHHRPERANMLNRGFDAG
jgi:hypothetical protein